MEQPGLQNLSLAPAVSPALQEETQTPPSTTLGAVQETEQSSPANYLLQKHNLF